LKEAIHNKLNKRQYLTRQGDVWPYVMFVITGQIRWAMLVTSGKEHILFNIEENKSFWGQLIFADGEMPALS